MKEGCSREFIYCVVVALDLEIVSSKVTDSPLSFITLKQTLSLS
ncbi:hypothetical protein SOVF_016360 [Spinacia oleracea]|nr:hypothetical protein SOVF_016360 [Spinacia oleracea]